MEHTLRDINTNTIEGRLLFAALAKITTTSETDKTPDQVLNQLFNSAGRMFEDPLPSSFSAELTQLINRHSKEIESNTPDFLLASFLMTCLAGFNLAVSKRDELRLTAFGQPPSEHLNHKP